MSQSACRFSYNCTRSDCWFSHPHGRAIDGSPPPPAGAVASTGGKSGANVCRYGAGCTRKDCWYNHPDGRAIDQIESSGSSSSGRPGEVDEQGEFHCPCCGDKPFECTDPTCKSQGVCGCMYGDLDADDDDDEDQGDPTDEWFPSSRDCACCSGFIYRCTKKMPECQLHEECYCTVQQALKQRAAEGKEASAGPPGGLPVEGDKADSKKETNDKKDDSAKGKVASPNNNGGNNKKKGKKT